MRRRGARHRPVARAWSRRPGPTRRRLGFSVEGRVADAERIPYDDDTFDVVVGHAVIHHLPDVELAMREMLRVLEPGGRFVIAGEPTRIGDWYARALGRVTWKVATTVTSLPPLRDTWARPKEELDESSRAAALEAVVDLHTFDPDELARMALRAGAVDVGTTTEELTAAFLGWPVRTFEAAVRPGRAGLGLGARSPSAPGSACPPWTARWPGSCRSASSTTSVSPA